LCSRAFPLVCSTQRFLQRADTSRDGSIDEGEFVAFLARMTAEDSDERFGKRMDYLLQAILRGKGAAAPAPAAPATVSVGS
jgi:hypothetical protein